MTMKRGFARCQSASALAIVRGRDDDDRERLQQRPAPSRSWPSTGLMTRIVCDAALPRTRSSAGRDLNFLPIISSTCG